MESVAVVTESPHMDVRRLLCRRLRSTTLGGSGTPLLTQYPEETAEAVMAYVTPVLEARDGEIVQLKARVIALEAALEEVLDTYGPEPYPGQETAFFRGHLAVSTRKVREWWAVREGKSGSEGKSPPGPAPT